MTKDQLDQISRVEARQLIARIPAGLKYEDRVILAVEVAMNQEWWRGAESMRAAILQRLPGGQSCDPQDVADMIRAVEI